MNKKSIGIFDSGLGGLSVLSELKKILPNEKFIYFADSANLPYGEKSKEQLVGFTRDILNYFKSRDVKMVLMACNTSSAVTLNIVKNDYKFDILGLIDPAARFLASQNYSNIGIMATSATINSNAYKNKILKYANKNITQVACPGLVELVEGGNLDTAEAENLVRKYLEPILAQNVQKIVLGCTHYPFLSSLIEEITGRKDILINPAEFLAKEAFALLKSKNALNDSEEGTMEFYASASPGEFLHFGKNLFDGIDYVELLNVNLSQFKNSSTLFKA